MCKFLTSVRLWTFLLWQIGLTASVVGVANLYCMTAHPEQQKKNGFISLTPDNSIEYFYFRLLHFYPARTEKKKRVNTRYGWVTGIFIRHSMDVKQYTFIDRNTGQTRISMPRLITAFMFKADIDLSGLLIFQQRISWSI